MSADVRTLALVDLQIDAVRTLLAPVLGGAEIESFELADGGLVNTIYRVVVTGGHEALALRIYAAGVDAFEKERRLLQHVAPSVPVPDVLLASAGDSELPHPYIVYRWVDGMTLNECRRRMPTHALLSLAEPLGRLLAGVASVPLDGGNVASISVSTALGTAAEHLRRERTQARLGRALAGELRARFETAASRLVSADRARGPAHGDFGGRNVIVAPAGGDDWRVAALLDWEQSFVGATLWDVGSLFRYARRYTATFRDRFALGYRDAGGALTDDWYVTARLLDATRVVGILSAGRELPTVFAECREAIEALVSEG